MMGRTRHHVHASVHEDDRVVTSPTRDEPKDEKPGFFSRKIANILRRSSVAAGIGRVRFVESNSVVPATDNSSPAIDKSLVMRNKNGLRVSDMEIVFGLKNYAVVTCNGVRPANEDRFRVISNLELYGKGLITADRSVVTYQDALEKQLLEIFARDGNTPKMDLKKLLQHKTITNTEFYGVFDGHGGAACSSMLAMLMPLYLLLSPDFHNNLIAAAKRACLTINDEILRRESADQCSGGSTALVVMIRSGVAYICNIGDCRAILISRSGVQPLTTDHKAANEKEKQRIEEAGGLVLYVKGVARVNGRLAVTRAFGDAELQQYVIANPEITCHQLTAQDEYIVVASDGLWDTLSNEQVMACIRNNPWLSIEEVAQVLINRAIEEGSMDNITVLVIDVRKR